ncbi:MAG: NUDIX domain-containing protein [Planctomycetota bacterium]|jgi:8-oxo-dGTP diphosphatase
MTLESFREPVRMFVTTDVVAFSMLPEKGLQVLLVKRANPPFKAHWALPGGFVDEDEDLPDAAVRELREETGLQMTTMLHLGVWGRPGRDPRGRNVSVAYVTGVRPEEAKVEAGSDAEQVKWHPVSYLPQLAFDHKSVVSAGLRRLRSLVAGTHFVYRLLPEPFLLEQLRDTLTAVSGELVTAQEALAFAKRCRVIKEARDVARDKELYRCVGGHLLTPLR